MEHAVLTVYVMEPGVTPVIQDMLDFEIWKYVKISSDGP